VVPAVPAALTAGGHALTAEAPAPGGVRMSGVVTQGPLRWRWPTACVGTCPEGPVWACRRRTLVRRRSPPRSRGCASGAA